jgi:hypothetical protein
VLTHNGSSEYPWKFLSIIGRDPSVSKSNRLQVVVFRFSFIHSSFTPYIPLEWGVILRKSWTSTGYFSNSTGSFVTNHRLGFSSFIGWSQHEAQQSQHSHYQVSSPWLSACFYIECGILHVILKISSHGPVTEVERAQPYGSKVRRGLSSMGRIRMHRELVLLTYKVETPYHDNDLILAPIISPQSGW